MKHFHYRFFRNYESCKVETWYTHGQGTDVLCVPESGPKAYISWSYNLQFAINEKVLSHFSQELLRLQS